MESHNFLGLVRSGHAGLCGCLRGDERNDIRCRLLEAELMVRIVLAGGRNSPPSLPESLESPKSASEEAANFNVYFSGFYTKKMPKWATEERRLTAEDKKHLCASLGPPGANWVAAGKQAQLAATNKNGWKNLEEAE